VLAGAVELAERRGAGVVSRDEMGEPRCALNQVAGVTANATLISMARNSICSVVRIAALLL
jgi:hypothetical protein